MILIQEFIFLPVESFQAIDDSRTSPGIAPHPNSTSNSDRDVRAEIFATRDKITVLVDKCDRLHTRYGTLENWATRKLDDLSGDVLKLSNVFREHKRAVTEQMDLQKAVWDEQRNALETIIARLQDVQPSMPPTQIATDARNEDLSWPKEYFAQKESEREKIIPTSMACDTAQGEEEGDGKNLGAREVRAAGAPGSEGECGKDSGKQDAKEGSLGSLDKDTASGEFGKQDADAVSSKSEKRDAE